MTQRTRNKNESDVSSGKVVTVVEPPLTFKERMIQQLINSTPAFNDQWEIAEKQAWYEHQRWLFDALNGNHIGDYLGDAPMTKGV